VVGCLLNQDVYLFLVVALVACAQLVLGNTRLVLTWLVRVVEFKSSQLILDALNYNFGNLVQLIVAQVFFSFILHQDTQLHVFDVARKLAFLEFLQFFAALALKPFQNTIDNLLANLGLLVLVKFGNNIQRFLVLFNLILNFLFFGFFLLLLSEHLGIQQAERNQRIVNKCFHDRK